MEAPPQRAGARVCACAAGIPARWEEGRLKWRGVEMNADLRLQAVRARDEGNREELDVSLLEMYPEGA